MMENINNAHKPIKDWAADDRPREKMLNLGPESLSAVELLAILIQNGTRSKTAIDLARELMFLSGNSVVMLGRMSLQEIQRVKGIGPAKAVTIKAALQLATEKEKDKLPIGKTINSQSDLLSYLQQKIGNETREHFLVLYLNRRSKLIRTETLSIGGTTATIVDPRILLRHAIEVQASYIILSHNHPSGNPQPSSEDKALTKKLKEAARLFDITVLDHLIVTPDQHYSFSEDGQM